MHWLRLTKICTVFPHPYVKIALIHHIYTILLFEFC